MQAIQSYIDYNLEPDYDLLDNKHCPGCGHPKAIGEALCCICLKKIGPVLEDKIKAFKPGEGLANVVGLVLREKRMGGWK